MDGRGHPPPYRTPIPKARIENRRTVTRTLSENILEHVDLFAERLLRKLPHYGRIVGDMRGIVALLL